jgi:hypothetical protein
MHFDKDAELDPRLAGVALATLHSTYVQHYEGYGLCETFKEHGQADDRAKIARRIEKALDAAFVDLELLVNAISSSGGTEVPTDVGQPELLTEIYWRIHDGWSATTAPPLKMIEVDGATPVWDDFTALCNELARMDTDGGDGDSLPDEWYEDLVARHEARIGKPKAKKAAAKRADAKAAAAKREPPPGAEIRDYSTKSTFEVGQWVRHPTLGVGIVVEVGQHATIEMSGHRKVLAHVAAGPAPVASKATSSKPTKNVEALARAAGIEIKRVPPKADEEK